MAKASFSAPALSKKAQKLLDAQVAFTLDQLTGKNLKPLIEENVHRAMQQMEKIKLNDVVSCAHVEQVALKYAADMDVGPGIPELVGEISREIYHHPILDSHTLGDLISDQDLTEILEKVAEMDKLRAQIISEVIDNPMYSALASDLVYHGIRDYISDNPLSKKIPGAKSVMKMGKSVMDKASPNLETMLKKYVAKNTRATLRESERFLQKNLTHEKIVEVGLDSWSKIKDTPLKRVRKYISERDVEETFVTGFEYWKHLRTTEVYQAAIKAGVAFFFKKYGKASLADLLDDIGLTEAMIVEDALRFAPDAIKGLKAKGFLEQLIRDNLLPFYQSDAAQALLAD